MQSAPWRIFNHDGREIIIDVDGGITIDEQTANPFPADITHASLCDGGLIATWVEHELRLARMALLPLDEKFNDGVSNCLLYTSDAADE